MCKPDDLDQHRLAKINETRAQVIQGFLLLIETYSYRLIFHFPIHPHAPDVIYFNHTPFSNNLMLNYFFIPLIKNIHLLLNNYKIEGIYFLL